jgi:cyclic pyranopterin phosphate synthase
MKMIDVGAKPRTERVAVARGLVRMKAATVGIVRRGESEKGDVIAAARIAGILAAKHTPDIVPLCHPVALSAVEVRVEPAKEGVRVEATVRTVDRTGVEMEALAAVCAACLCVYDMLKRYERGMRIEAVELMEKKGGRSGHWLRPSAAEAAGRAPPRGRSPASRSRSRRRPGGRRPR